MSSISSSVNTPSLFPKNSRSQTKGHNFTVCSTVFFSWCLAIGFPQSAFPVPLASLLPLWSNSLAFLPFFPRYAHFCAKQPSSLNQIYNMLLISLQCTFQHWKFLCCFINSSLSSGSMLHVENSWSFDSE